MSSSASASEAMPVYFVSHGGPNLLDPADYPASEPIAQGLARIGREIRALNPRALLVLSGHWEAGASSLQINGKSALPQPLIYDFYGFPAAFYEEKFPHAVSPQFTEQVAELVSKADIPIEVVDRGLDHGVWVVLKKAGLADAPFPIVQLSLFHNDSMSQHVRLGEVLSELREQGVVVVGSGMAVHNLRDLFGPGAKAGVRSYVPLFDKEIEAALRSSDRRQAVIDLEHSDYLRRAHPTLEHLLPLHVAVGAAKDAKTVNKMLEAYQVSMSWSCYKFT
ncbi:hypothetical protein LPJ53_001779 [Coemansia erecta]|uniref:Extradiol ring-cleavage dioxygenase class III enzyme subunit B domain-containing protein n=1 Tax=Coemansia erecta TaxID=147472 RepID=A0A9W8CSH5_9FUNG|nr:hypothetical protein LPJ53_001779 [Coemansia erecta]